MDWVNPHYHANGDIDGDSYGHVDGHSGTGHTPVSATGEAETGRLYELPARRGRAVRLRQGQRLKIVNPEGTQVCDFWAFCQDGVHEFLSMEHVRAGLSKLTPATGDTLVTNRRRPILRLLHDSSEGVHDTLIAACDLPRYRTLGVAHYHDNCADNLRIAMRAIGLPVAEVPAPFNLWMNNPVAADGHIGWLPPRARPGDQLVFEALLDCVAVLSACPQDLVPVNGADCRPTGLAFEVLPAEASA